MGYNYAVRKSDSTIELYIDRGKGADTENLDIFNQLQSNKGTIEQVYGGKLSWEPLDSKRACRISDKIQGGYRDPEDQWSKIHANKVD